MYGARKRRTASFPPIQTVRKNTTRVLGNSQDGFLRYHIHVGMRNGAHNVVALKILTTAGAIPSVRQKMRDPDAIALDYVVSEAIKKATYPLALCPTYNVPQPA